jgi:hypothetical protein
MKTGTLFSGLCLAAMLLAQGTANAEVSQTILTENSPTSLTASNFTGITNVAPDKWTFSVGNFGSGFIPTSWIEPDNSLRFNNLTFNSQTSVLTLTSDAAIAVSAAPVKDGVQVNVANSTLPEFLFTFTDKAAAAEPKSVPDAGSTVILLGLALLGIEGLRRRFRIA